MNEPIIYEKEPLWLQAKIDQLLAKFRELGGEQVWAQMTNGQQVVAMFLTEPVENATPAQLKLWDQSCDRCMNYRPGEVWPGTVQRVIGLSHFIITFGVCPDCKDLS